MDPLFVPEASNRVRVILNTDAKNEADDQKYLVEQLVEWNKQHQRGGPIEHRSLGDSPAVGVMMYPECGWFEWRAAPEFNVEMNYVHTGRNRPIRVYNATTSPILNWIASAPQCALKLTPNIPVM